MILGWRVIVGWQEAVKTTSNFFVIDFLTRVVVSRGGGVMRSGEERKVTLVSKVAAILEMEVRT